MRACARERGSPGVGEGPISSFPPPPSSSSHYEKRNGIVNRMYIPRYYNNCTTVVVEVAESREALARGKLVHARSRCWLIAIKDRSGRQIYFAAANDICTRKTIQEVFFF